MPAPEQSVLDGLVFLERNRFSVRVLRRRPFWRHFKTVVGALLVLTSVVANLVLWATLVEVYSELNRIRRNPFELGNYALTEVENVAGLRKVVFFGDSRIEDWSPMPKLRGVNAMNRGIGGQTSAQVLGRVRQHVLALHPDLVVLQVCVNDLKVLGAFEDEKEKLVEECVENITRIALALRPTKVLVTTVFPVGPVDLMKRMTIWSDSVLSAVREVNERLRKLNLPNVQVIDCDPILSEHGRMRTPFARDTYHLTEAGYRALNHHLAPKITRALAED